MINIFNNRSKKELKLLKEILAEVRALKQDLIDNSVIAKAASDLDASTNKLNEAVEKNQPK